MYLPFYKQCPTVSQENHKAKTTVQHKDKRKKEKKEKKPPHPSSKLHIKDFLKAGSISSMGSF
jgi:hypothetical protein